MVVSVIGPTPGLFERIPRGLFGPLGDPYAELYWELLSTLYTCEFEREPFTVVRPVAIEIAENAIRSSSLWTERRADRRCSAAKPKRFRICRRSTRQTRYLQGQTFGFAADFNAGNGLQQQLQRCADQGLRLSQDNSHEGYRFFVVLEM